MSNYSVPKKIMFLSSFLVFTFIVAACSPAVPAVEDTVASEALPTEAAPTPVPPTTEPPTVLYDDVSFSFGADVAGSWTVEFVPQGPGSSGSAGPVDHTDPDHLVFSLDNYAVPSDNPNSLHLPSIYIYPVAEMVNQNPGATIRIADLQAYLGSPPENLMDQTQPIPFLPLFNASQVFHTQVKFVDFQNGQGVRFLTMYAQSPMPVVNAGIFYTFQGLTSDGAYYVAMTLPVNSPVLKVNAEVAFDEEGDDFMTDPWNYLDGIAEQLDRQASHTFLPDLAALDAMVESLLVRP